jgi:hypothetical protein
MASGIEMMMKSFGFDKEKIKAEITAAAEPVIKAVMDRVTSIEETQKRIEAKLDTVIGTYAPHGMLDLPETHPAGATEELPEGVSSVGHFDSAS